MRKLLIIFMAFLCLVGCGIEESPENYFDIALTEIEEADAYQTQVTLKENDEELISFLGTYEDGDMQVSPMLYSWQEAIASFQLGDVFSNFSYDEVNHIVYCEIDKTESSAIMEMISSYSDETIETISQEMYLNDLSIDYVMINIETTTNNYICTIDVVE